MDAAELALIETSRAQREYLTMITDTNFMTFWRAINAQRIANDKPELGFGEVDRLWKEANK